MKKIFIEKKIEQVIHIIEMIIAILLAVGVAVGLVDLVKYFPQIFLANPAESYDIFQDFLGHALVLIVGVELILMILHHSTKAILELILFVIARKMLIYSNTMTDLVFGTAAIAIIFVVLKFLVEKNEDSIVRKESGIYSATTKVEDLLSETGFAIPSDRSHTLGELVCNLAEEACKSIEEGAEFYIGDIKITVIKATEAGVVEEVMITNNTI